MTKYIVSVQPFEDDLDEDVTFLDETYSTLDSAKARVAAELFEDESDYGTMAEHRYTIHEIKPVVVSHVTHVQPIIGFKEVV